MIKNYVRIEQTHKEVQHAKKLKNIILVDETQPLEQIKNQDVSQAFHSQISNFFSSELLKGNSLEGTYTKLQNILDRDIATAENIYIIQLSNTLSEIAQANGMSLNELLALNPKYKDNHYDVKAGALLILKDNTGTQS